MNDEIISYISNKKNSLGDIDFDNFIESDEYNNMDDNSKRDLFYMVTFIMSAKNYKKFNTIINDFVKIIEFIKDNEYLQNTHECYETLICNYLSKIRELLSKNDVIENQKELIESLSIFKDEIINLYYPNNDIKPNIIKNLDKIVKQIELNEEISDENIIKYKR